MIRRRITQREPVELGELYLGDDVGLAAFLKTVTTRYTYVLHRPDGRPFYVGQGQGTRVLQHAVEARLPDGAKLSNPYKINVIRMIEREGGKILYRIDAIHADLAAADRREIEVIASIGRIKDGGTLTNLVAGGGGCSDPSPETKEKHRQTLGGIPDQEGDRRTVNSVLATFEDRGSIAIKPLSEFKPHRLICLKADEKKATKGKLTVRAAMALGVSAAVNGVVLAPGCRIPRKLDIEGVPAIIENGVGRRILASETCVIEGETVGEEVFIADAAAVQQIIEVVGRDRLEAAGVLPVEKVAQPVPAVMVAVVAPVPRQRVSISVKA